MRRLISILLLTIWLLMTGNSSNLFAQSNSIPTTTKQGYSNLTSLKEATMVSLHTVEAEDKVVYYEEEEEEDDEEAFHQTARLHAIILYQLLFVGEAPIFLAAKHFAVGPSNLLSTPVYLACQNIRI